MLVLLHQDRIKIFLIPSSIIMRGDNNSNWVVNTLCPEWNNTQDESNVVFFNHSKLRLKLHFV